jgi:hypothetical protein
MEAGLRLSHVLNNILKASEINNFVLPFSRLAGT